MLVRDDFGRPPLRSVLRGFVAVGAVLMASTSAWADGKRHPGQVKSTVPLDAVHQAIRHNLDHRYERADPFAQPAASAFQGRTFRVEVRVRDASIPVKTPAWAYADGQLTLSWGTSDGFAIDDDVKKVSSYLGENGFGAAVRVEKYEQRTNYLEPQNENVWAVHATLPFEAAKAKLLVQNLVAVIEGTITEFPIGEASLNEYSHYVGVDGYSKKRPVSCETEFTVPTFDWPMSTDDTICHVAIKLDRISFMNRVSREIIWSHDYVATGAEK